MSPVPIVRSLRIHAVSGDTLYPDENGFSAVWGEVDSDDAAITNVLDQVLQVGTAVSLRCGALEITGKLYGREARDDGCHYRIDIHRVQYGSGSA
jgi:hypothetical protein